jgi:hypothetical protein
MALETKGMDLGPAELSGDRRLVFQNTEMIGLPQVDQR